MGKKATFGAGGETFAKHYCALTFVKMTFIQEQLKQMKQIEALDSCIQ